MAKTKTATAADAVKELEAMRRESPVEWREIIDAAIRRIAALRPQPEPAATDETTPPAS
jgi:hypothetical protein